MIHRERQMATLAEGFTSRPFSRLREYPNSLSVYLRVMRSIVCRREMLGSLGAFFAAGRASFAAGGVSVGMIPDAGATQVAIDQKAPLRDYLTRAIGQPVKLVIPTNYNATV